MEDAFSAKLNDMLVESFRLVLKIEEQMLKNSKHLNLTISEMHLIEAVYKGGPEGLTISSLAERMGVSVPSVTIAINKLSQKGYVLKSKNAKDGRRVHVTLTPAGRKVNTAHRYFHRQMVHKIVGDMNETEKRGLISGIDRLNEYFRKQSEALEE